MNHNNFTKYLKKITIKIISILILVSNLNYSQSITVSGKVTSSRFPVANAEITFIDNADTTLQYSALTDSRGAYEIGLVTSVESNNNQVPTKFKLGQNYPNPFSSTTAIPYTLNEEAKVNVKIYDVLGREVKKFSPSRENIGTHQILWDGKNNFGQKVSNGIYFYQFEINGKSQVKKLVYNQAVVNSLTISSSINFNSESTFEKINQVNNSSGTDFRIRLANTSSTTPLIEELELPNVSINNDTTISFDVNTLSIVTIDLDSTHQTIRGFGASNILMWRPDMTDGEIQNAFGTDDGQLGFTILRIMVEPDSNRWALNLNTAKKAQDLGAIVIASPWYAPSNMVETVNGVSRVKHDMYEEYAEHLNSFTKFMNDNGAPLYGISIQNEPDITDQWTSWTIDEMYTFMRDYAHLLEGTKVMAPESFQFRRNMTDPILNDSIACENTDIICGHIYGGGLADYPLAHEKGKEVWMTEYLINGDMNGENMDTSWTAAMATANSFNDCMNANMSTYIWWYLVRYYGPMCDGTFLRKGEITKKGYVMSQFARFVRPGFVRVESSVLPITSEVELSAYKDTQSSKVIIIAINNGNKDIDQKFRLNNSIKGTFETYRSSSAKDCDLGDQVVVEDGNFNFILEASSITTFVLQ
jgi:glucuronoarabinoxylan endo-1,4-beta-xylanase